MSPLWGFKTFRHLVFYKHAAPLGLQAYRPFGALGGKVDAALYKHVAPLGLWEVRLMPPSINMPPLWGYKHIAPLGLQAYRPSGALGGKVDVACSINISPLWG